MSGNILDIGCGINKVPDAVGLDIDSHSHADIIHDLNAYPYPIKDNEFNTIYAKHIIEHLDDPEGFIKEIYWILAPQGQVFIETPHFTSYVAYSEPQHKLPFSYFMLKNISDKIGFQSINISFTFYKTFRMVGIKALANRFPRNYERFWTYIFPAENLILTAVK